MSRIPRRSRNPAVGRHCQQRQGTGRVRSDRLACRARYPWLLSGTHTRFLHSACTWLTWGLRRYRLRCLARWSRPVRLSLFQRVDHCLRLDGHRQQHRVALDHHRRAAASRYRQEGYRCDAFFPQTPRRSRSSLVPSLARLPRVHLGNKPSVALSVGALDQIFVGQLALP